MIRLLVTSGRGPTECRIAVARTLDVMRREAEAAGLALDIAESENRDGHGPASALVLVAGVGEAAFATSWTGSVLWVAQSPVRPHHRRKNWFVGVFSTPAADPAPARLDLAEVRFETFRAGGPGGQHQNRTESAVRAIHGATGLSVVAREERSQHRNKALALERLGRLLDARCALGALEDRNRLQAGHDRLERGRPVRRFTG